MSEASPTLEGENGLDKASQFPQPEASAPTAERGSSSTFTRLVKYMSVRVVLLFLTVVAGVYLTILIANMGGFVDNMRRGAIREQVALMLQADQNFRQLPREARDERMEEIVRLQEEALGLNRPFIVRSFDFLKDALTMDLGRADLMSSDTGSQQVQYILLERLPATLVLFATANLVLFFVSLFAGLFLSRRYGSLLDKIVIALAPTSSAPGWFYGLFLILIFAALLGVLPFGAMVDAPPPEEPVAYALSLGKHLILPVSAIIISAIFLNAYNMRTFFLIYSSEDYVEMAKAKGLSSREIERRYILRPTLPTIITNFALTLITLWQGAIILETVFNWPGLGRAYFQAVGLYDTAVIVGNTIVYAYLLAITVFVLDFIYAWVDPRVRVGGGGTSV